MFIRTLGDCQEFLAGDHTRLRELLHPDKADLGPVRYSLAHARVGPGLSSVPHRLKTSEVYYIMEGRGLMDIDGEKAEVAPGDTVYIPPGASQHITNIGHEDIVFLCIVDPAWRVEDEEVL
jgi:mannose-6-phosphate isomerase-like protein (cupin superfamily)